jgi:hypothetical protein
MSLSSLLGLPLSLSFPFNFPVSLKLTSRRAKSYAEKVPPMQEESGLHTFSNSTPGRPEVLRGKAFPVTAINRENYLGSGRTFKIGRTSQVWKRTSIESQGGLQNQTQSFWFPDCFYSCF